MHFDVFPGCQFAFEDAPCLCVVRVLHRQVLEVEGCGLQGIILWNEPGERGCDQRWNEAASLAPRKSHTHLIVFGFFDPVALRKDTTRHGFTFVGVLDARGAEEA